MEKTRNPLAENIFLNAKIIAKRKGYKIGELERKCRVSAGYLTRTFKSGMRPGIEIVFNLAIALETTVETLCDCPPEQNTENVVTVHDFAQKLVMETMKGNLEWQTRKNGLFCLIPKHGFEVSVMEWVRPSGKQAYELSFHCAGHEERLYNSERDEIPFLYRAVAELHRTALQAASSVKLQPEVRQAIDEFMEAKAI